MAGVETRSSTMPFVLLSGLVMLLSVLAATKDVVSLPPLPASDHDYLENCGAKLHPTCGKEIKAAMYANGKISNGCCKDLVAEGRTCHDKFVEVTAPYYPKLTRSDALTKAAQAWSNCAAASPKN